MYLHLKESEVLDNCVCLVKVKKVCGSSAIWHFEHGGEIKIHDRVIFDFYTGLSQMSTNENYKYTYLTVVIKQRECAH